MKKFLTLFFAFTCLAFSEMRGQNVFISTNYDFGPFYKMQTEDGVVYSFTFGTNQGNPIGLAGFYFIESYNDIYPIPSISYSGISTFPIGIASANNNGNDYGIQNSTGFKVTFNRFTKEYVFSLNFKSSLAIYSTGQYWLGPTVYGNSCKLEVTSSGFSNFQWRRNGVNIPGANQSTYFHPADLNAPSYVYDCSTLNTYPNGDTATLISNQITVKTAPPVASLILQSSQNFCDQRKLILDIGRPYPGWVVEWKKNSQIINGINGIGYAPPSSNQDAVYSAKLTCPNNSSISVLSNDVSISGCYADSTSAINYMLVQNVTTTGNNASNKTTQVQFDLSWGKTWWDDINWDAAWVFMKYKTAAGEWKHAKINPTGYDHGQGTPNIIQPTADKLGAFIRLGLEGQGNFNAEGMQLQWNYGLDGISSVNGLEVKVFAIEMVYQPQGDFTVSRQFRDFEDFKLSAPGNNIAVINSRLSPVLSSSEISLRIKGDAGLDWNKDGIVENTDYPTGFLPFYLFKYEMSEQQYADFLNCLTPSQITNIGLAGTSITLNQGQYYSAFPNRACLSWPISAAGNRLFAYADWSGLRPISFLELNKAFSGGNPPNQNFDYSGYWPPLDASGANGSGVFGSKGLSGNLAEPFIMLKSTGFRAQNGNGQLNSEGWADVSAWIPADLNWGSFGNDPIAELGFRLCRSAE